MRPYSFKHYNKQYLISLCIMANNTRPYSFIHYDKQHFIPSCIMANITRPYSFIRYDKEHLTPSRILVNNTHLLTHNDKLSLHRKKKHSISSRTAAFIFRINLHTSHSDTIVSTVRLRHKCPYHATPTQVSLPCYSDTSVPTMPL